MLGIPTLVQEQNSFPGKTNKLLAKNVNTLCTAYEGLERFFPKEKIQLTGNPVRFEMVNIAGKRQEAFDFYQLDSAKKTILVIGGSLGARTLNQAMMEHSNLLQDNNVQVLWQCGKLYFESLSEQLNGKETDSIKMVQFIDRMDLAYAIADVIISRAGAISVSELCLIAKPIILVPSPNVSEDHQTKNAMALVDKNAALLVKDSEAKEKLIPTAIGLLDNELLRAELAAEITKLGKPKATESIVDEIEKIAK
jgi:UDP-N-acetylglucosamine--N-acetylmuramyl-(pentapeptide) pyrophosphoryl-undecaprenol N-acetylglucosamine transferase